MILPFRKLYLNVLEANTDRPAQFTWRTLKLKEMWTHPEFGTEFGFLKFQSNTFFGSVLCLCPNDTQI